MMNRCSSRSNIANGNSKSIALFYDDFVITEILSRLPVKTLMRFKSACKRWRSTIQHDPHFHQLHFNHSRLGLYLVHQNYEATILGQSEYLLSAPGLIKRARSGSAAAATLHSFRNRTRSGSAAAAAATLHSFRNREKLRSEGNLYPVNGLAYLVDVVGKAFCIYNPSTLEETQWIRPTSKRTKPSKLQRFYFGFDLVTKKHKVIFHQILDYKHSRKYTYKVLTLGDNSWRRIDDDQVPSHDLRYGCGTYVNGAIYWSLKVKWGNFMQLIPTILLEFDLGSEKFREMPIPDFIINLPIEDDPRKWKSQPIDILEVDGHVALLRRRNKTTVIMWILFEDDATDHNRNWTEVIIILPFDWEGENNRVCFYTIPGSACQILVTTHIDGEAFSAYSCNWKNNAFTKVELEFGGFSSPQSGPFFPHNTFC